MYLFKYDASSSVSNTNSDSNIKDTSSKWQNLLNFHFISRDLKQKTLFHIRKFILKFFDLYSKTNRFVIIIIIFLLFVTLFAHLHFLGFYIDNFEDICNIYLLTKTK